MLPVYLLGGRWLIKCTQKHERRHGGKTCISLHVAPGISWGKCRNGGLCTRCRIGCACTPFLSCARWIFPPMTVQNIGGGCLSVFGGGLSWLRWRSVCLLLVVGGGLPFVAVRLPVSIGGGIRSRKETFLYTIYIFRKHWQRGAVWCIV